ncbi:MAG: SDR family oxidoreductase, partial [Frankiales bacterium]|nr:SDR family oxidoreductase [Frankiales bacterium]
HGFPAGVDVAEAAVTTDANGVAAAIAGREAVIVALGPRSPLDDNLLTSAMANILPAMEASGVHRLVVVSALGLSTALPAPLPLRAVGATLLRRTAGDKRRSEDLIRASRVDCTLVLPGPLTGRPSRGQLRPTTSPQRPMGRVSRADLGALLIRLAEQPNGDPAVAVEYATGPAAD